MAQRDLKITLIGDDKTGGAFGSAGKNADGIGSKFAKFGTIAAAGVGAAAAGIGLFAKSGVDAFARVEDATSNAGVQFGKAAPQIVAFAEGASKSIGLSKGAALDAANTFATMGSAAGMSGTDLAGFSTKFTTLAGDLASFKGTSPEQAIEAIGAALRGEAEPIRAYGVLLDDASLRQEALKQGLIKTTKEALTPQQKVLASQALILAQTTKAQGDYEATSTSTANVQKTLAAETENASARLGQQLAPAVTAARTAFLGLIEGASGLITTVGPYIAQAQLAFSAFFAALREGDVTSDGLVGKFETVGDALHRFGTAAIPITQAAFAGLITTFTAVGQAVMATVNFFRQHDTAAKALGVVVAAVAAGVAAAWVAQGVVATVNAAKNVLAWVTTATASTTSATIQSKSTAQIVVGWAAQAAAATVNAAKVVVGWVATGAGAVAAGAVHAAQVARHVAGWVLLGAQSLLHAAKVAAAWLIAMGPIGLVIAAVVGLVAVVIANWDTIRTKTAALWNAVKEMTSSAWAAIKGAVSTGVEGVMGFIRDLPGRIKDALGGLGGLLVNAGRELMEGLARGIGEKIEAVIAKVRQAVQKIKDLLPGSPVKTGPLTSWNNGGAGKRLMAMLSDGIVSGTPGVRSALAAALDAADVAGMNLGGSGYVNSRLAATTGSAPAEQASSGADKTDQMIALLIEQNELLRRMPRQALLAERAR